MRKNLCTSIIVFFTLLFTNEGKMHHINKKIYNNEEINKAWFKVPWTHGGYYWHNRITHEDMEPKDYQKRYNLKSN